MTNPNPKYSVVEIQFDSSGRNSHPSIGKLSCVSPSSVKVVSSQKNSFPNALLSPESPVSSDEETGMDQKIQPGEGVRSSSISSSKGPLSCSSSATTKIEESKKRSISFLVDNKNRIVEEVHEYPFDPVDHEDVWWTDDELDKLLTDAMLMAQHFTRKCKDWQNKIKLLLKGCGGKSKDAEPIPLKAADLDFVVDSDARGLELYIHPIFQKNRVKAIKSVVKVQAEYNASEEKKGAKDQELRVKVLRFQSLKLTQTARLLAKTMADGDARVVAKQQREDEEAAEEMADETESEQSVVAVEKSAEQPDPSPVDKDNNREGTKETSANIGNALSELHQRRRRATGAGGFENLQQALEDLTDEDSEASV